MLTINKLKTSNGIYLPKDHQLDLVNFESPLQQVLQEQALLLRLLNQQNRWQFWISARPMLKRSWISQSGLSEQKVVHLPNANPTNMVALIEKALLSKTASYIAVCIDTPLSNSEKYRLQQAVKISGTHLFLIDDNYLNYNDFMTMSLAVNNIH